MITRDELIPQPSELVLQNGTPETIAGWKELAGSLLTDQACAFHRNLEISSRYAWIYTFMPAGFKWAGMAAFASHHVRLALFPFRLAPIAPATWTSRTAWLPGGFEDLVDEASVPAEAPTTPPADVLPPANAAEIVLRNGAELLPG